MASDRVEWVRRQVDLLNSGDVEALLESIGPDFTFRPDPSFPDADAYRGEDLRRWLGEWVRVWGESRLELLELSEVASAVVAKSRWHLTTAGQAIPNQDFSLVVWFAGERAVAGAGLFDEERALEAARAGPG